MSINRRIYDTITEEERIKCQKVVEVFADFMELHGDMTVASAGKWGFVHLCYYDGDSFAGSRLYQNSKELFEVLWEYWRDYMLLEAVMGTPMQEYDYEKLYELLKPEERQRYIDKRMEFWHAAFGEENV